VYRLRTPSVLFFLGRKWPTYDRTRLRPSPPESLIEPARGRRFDKALLTATPTPHLAVLADKCAVSGNPFHEIFGGHRPPGWGLARGGNARVRRGMIQLAWRFLMFQKESALALWYRARPADSGSGTRKTMIVALARKLITALWRFVTTGEPLEGVVLRPAT